MDVLGTKLGPIVFQFPFFNKSAFQDRHEFLDRLVPFLAKLRTGLYGRDLRECSRSSGPDFRPITVRGQCRLFLRLPRAG
jgi:hypothetical protein